MRKLMMPLVAGLLLSAATTAVSQTAPPAPAQPQAQPPAVTQLVPYTSGPGRFTIDFPPGNVEPTTQVLPLNGGGSVTQYVFYVEADNGNASYMASYSDYTTPITAAADTLERSRDGMTKSAACTLTSDVPFDLNGVPGRAFTCANNGFHFSARSFVIGNRLYQILVVSKPGHPPAYLDEFLNSFRIM
jgi:hypothetical protein